MPRAAAHVVQAALIGVGEHHALRGEEEAHKAPAPERAEAEDPRGALRTPASPPEKQEKVTPKRAKKVGF